MAQPIGKPLYYVQTTANVLWAGRKNGWISCSNRKKFPYAKYGSQTYRKKVAIRNCRKLDNFLCSRGDFTNQIVYDRYSYSHKLGFEVRKRFIFKRKSH